MTTKDEFDPDDALRLIPSADEPEPGIGSDRAVISLRFVMASILVVTATAIGISMLSVRNPVTLSADVTASVDPSAPEAGTDEAGTDEPMQSIQSAVIQSTADAEAPQTAKDAPTREISESEPTSQTRAENSEASEALFREFQAWKAKQDARDSAKPVQDDPASVAENAPASSVRPMQKHRRALTVQNARADIIQHVQKRGTNIRRQNERAQARPAQDARAQTQPVQYAEPPSLLERLNPFGASPLQR